MQVIETEGIFCLIQFIKIHLTNIRNKFFFKTDSNSTLPFNPKKRGKIEGWLENEHSGDPNYEHSIDRSIQIADNWSLVFRCQK